MKDMVAVGSPSIPTFSDLKAYLLSSVFIVANLVFPWAAHHVGLAGPTFLPLYFFSLVGGLLYGSRVGMITGFASPVLSFLLSGMPPLMILPFVVVKSVLLGTVGGWMAYSNVRPHGIFFCAVSAVLVSQIIGSAVILQVTGKMTMAIADIAVGYPGLLLQAIGAPVLVSLIRRNAHQTSSGDHQEN